jgi:hypothetical protein
LQEFALLAIERQQPGFGVPATPLVLSQWHHAGHVGFGEPLDLLAERCPTSAKVGPASLHLLRQPAPAAGPLHRMRDHLRRGEDFAQVAPDQLLQRPGRDVASRTAFARRQHGQLCLGAAQVVVIAFRHVTSRAAAAASAAADQAAQEVPVHPVVASRHAPIIAQPLLRAVELLLADDGRHGRDRDPFGRVNQPRAALAATDRQQGGAAPLRRMPMQPVGEDLPEVDGVGQQIAQDRGAPAPVSPG